MDWIEIGSDALTAAINPFGAELSSLRGTDGRERMTDADPAFWTGRAPLLFPIVGGLNGDTYWLDGREYRMAKHGFARRQAFAVVERAADRVVLRLSDSDATRESYPFAFTLDAAFTVEGTTLRMEVTATNRDTCDMPASFGFHPAFAWDRQGGAIVFEKPEPAPIRRLNAQGLVAVSEAPLDGTTLVLADAPFEKDALIWDALESERVRFGDLDIAFPGAPMLGIWTKPGASFVCVEPWWGIADPAGFDGEIWGKPGILRLAPGEARRFTMAVMLAG